jgi:NTP pyrophosphatase (non-canonical NTP hydrolase)
MKTEHKKVFEECIKHWGVSDRKNMVVEEMSELIKEISKNNRGEENRDKIIEEIADCYVVMKGLRVAFDIDDKQIDDIVDFKIKRLSSRLEKWKAEQNK